MPVPNVPPVARGSEPVLRAAPVDFCSQGMDTASGGSSTSSATQHLHHCTETGGGAGAGAGCGVRAGADASSNLTFSLQRNINTYICNLLIVSIRQKIYLLIKNSTSIKNTST